MSHVTNWVVWSNGIVGDNIFYDSNILQKITISYSYSYSYLYIYSSLSSTVNKEK